MQPDDIINAVGMLTLYSQVGILLFATFRAVQIWRALMRGVYKSRAFWTGVAMIIIIIANLSLFAGVSFVFFGTFTSLPTSVAKKDRLVT